MLAQHYKSLDCWFNLEEFSEPRQLASFLGKIFSNSPQTDFFFRKYKQMVTTRKKEVTFHGVLYMSMKVHISLGVLPLFFFLHPISPSGKTL